jgi:hypothetical protein
LGCCRLVTCLVRHRARGEGLVGLTVLDAVHRLLCSWGKLVG